jgi:hypothetical protein
MPQQVAANDPRFKWSGNISLEVNGDWVMPWRIEQDERELYALELTERASMPAGVHLSFQTDSQTLKISCDESDDRSNLDLVVNGNLVGSVQTTNTTSVRFDSLGTGTKNVELWLPQFGEFRFGGLAIDDNAVLNSATDSQAKKWITYGSSISQCSAADSPTKTWPAIVARTRGYDLTCLGFGGQCHLDPMIARIIRDRDADLISMCLGINIYGAESLNERTFYPGILGFVQIVREKHPTTPIALLSPIYSPGRETGLNAVGFSLQKMRDEVNRAVETLRVNGDENISYIDGLNVFDSDNAHLLPDDLHPNSEGYGIMADNILGLLPKV